MSEKAKGQNDRAWEALFEKYDILSRIRQEGKFVISAAQIKEYREPRLMAKFDHRINLPQIFSEHQLAILPISGTSLFHHPSVSPLRTSKPECQSHPQRSHRHQLRPGIWNAGRFSGGGWAFTYRFRTDGFRTV